MHGSDMREDLELALRYIKQGLDDFHQARVLVHLHFPDLAELGGIFLRSLEDWQADVRALLEPH